MKEEIIQNSIQDRDFFKCGKLAMFLIKWNKFEKKNVQYNSVRFMIEMIL